MPSTNSGISFTVVSGRYLNTPNAITIYNQRNPSAPISTVDEFAKQAYLKELDYYLTAFRAYRVSLVSEQISTCSNASWNSITGILGPP